MGNPDYSSQALNMPWTYGKNENFFSLRKCIRWEKRKIHLALCKAKLFFAVIFQIFVWVIPIIPLKSLQMILESFRINYPSLVRIARTIDQKHGIISLWGFCTKPFSKKHFPRGHPNSIHHLESKEYSPINSKLISTEIIQERR